MSIGNFHPLGLCVGCFQMTIYARDRRDHCKENVHKIREDELVSCVRFQSFEDVGTFKNFVTSIDKIAVTKLLEKPQKLFQIFMNIIAELTPHQKFSLKKFQSSCPKKKIKTNKFCYSQAAHSQDSKYHDS